MTQRTMKPADLGEGERAGWLKERRASMSGEAGPGEVMRSLRLAVAAQIGGSWALCCAENVGK